MRRQRGIYSLASIAKADQSNLSDSHPPRAAGGSPSPPRRLIHMPVAEALDEFDKRQIYWARKASAAISVYNPADRAALRARFEDRVEFLVKQQKTRLEAERISFEELRYFLKTK